MKFLTLSLLMLLIACNQQINLKSGDCIQKPDEIFVWKIISVESGSFSVINATKKEEAIMNKKSSGTWVKTNCPN
ncbi:MAG: hypothetical protein N4A33_05455 [Bacteriovoracaceae bacterium]|jgi:hypothetical protein|nr:hypothetical protein [Bacteriovoracaceae bacterium]